MAPKVPKELPQLKKSPVKSPKPLKPPNSPKKKDPALVDPQVLFLWTCIECRTAGKEGGCFGIDFAAVAGKLNITNSAANKRFSRLRISMKARESKDEQLKDEELKDDLDDSEMPQFEESLED
ncbi:hypothetical protein N7509_006126 [Penicillium cosmopolitanum]|uniref:Myb-like DNA-binding domain-containing protein n=1 Tax=Penicillium cosmopolitanum TaxID=1131564 RepID=A0A9X0BAR2_9EURO|nr:uncharacterized protein N7509_006126 [Penicillium cosmopolitanum]KAJ5398013.1 hypothetical protein N7509_006126 [Penicillium cosmopolitanum]